MFSCHYVMLFSVCIIYVTAIAFMCSANKHIIIIIIIIPIPSEQVIALTH